MELQKADEKGLSTRIRDNKTVSNEFNIVIQTICFDIGIRQALDENDINSAFNFIKRNFELMTLENIREAFDLFSASELDFNSPTFGHYNSFDNTFIGGVLSAYKRFKMNNNKNKPKLVPKAPENKPLTFDEAKAYTELIQKAHNDKNMPKNIKWNDIYIYLRKVNLISFNKNTAQEHQFKVKRSLQNERNQRRLDGRGTIDLDLNIESKMFFYSECRKRAIIDYFND